MGKERLIPNSQRSPEQVRANGRKGGLKSGESRRRKKELKELLNIALSMVNEESDMTNAELLVASMINKAIDGDVKAATFVRDTSGQKPIDQVEVKNAEINISIEDNDD